MNTSIEGCHDSVSDRYPPSQANTSIEGCDRPARDGEPVSRTNTSIEGCHNSYGWLYVRNGIRHRRVVKSLSLGQLPVSLSDRYPTSQANTSIEGCRSAELVCCLQLSFNDGLDLIIRDHLDTSVFGQCFKNRVRGFTELELEEHPRTGTVATAFEVDQ